MTALQKTIGNSFELSGIGLHTGVSITLKAHPSSIDSGVLIRRTDLPGQPEIPALADYVSQTVRGTVLSAHGVSVSTIEHAMAALYASGIDNCLFEVDGPEFPILDGSARLYMRKLSEVGIVTQDAPKKVIHINEEIIHHSDNGSVIKALPAGRLEIVVHIGFDSEILEDQTAELLNQDDFATAISDARTFVFVREIEPLLKMNLIKGGDLKNAIVIYDRPITQDAMDALTEKLHQPAIDASKLGYITGELKFENEPARHKLLDVIGDIALVGCQIKGRIEATFPGHKINTEFAKIIREKYSL